MTKDSLARLQHVSRQDVTARERGRETEREHTRAQNYQQSAHPVHQEARIKMDMSGPPVGTALEEEEKAMKITHLLQGVQ